jgi:hypothetical protein
VGAFKGIGEFEGKLGSLEKLCEWVVWISISSFVYFIGWKHSVGKDHYMFVDDFNSMLGYVNC